MWAVILLIGSQGFKLAVPALAGSAINTLQAQGIDGLSQAGQMLLLVFLATLASWLMHGPGAHSGTQRGAGGAPARVHRPDGAAVCGAIGLA